MTTDASFQRIARVFLSRLLVLYGKDAPAQLRQVANELEALQREAEADVFNVIRLN